MLVVCRDSKTSEILFAAERFDEKEGEKAELKNIK